MKSDPLSHPLIVAAPPTLSLKELSAVIEDEYGFSGALEMLGGERDRNVLLVRRDAPPCLVKLAHPAEDADITDFQVAALLHLEKADPTLPVPRVLRTRKGEAVVPFDCGPSGMSRLRVQSFLPGEPIAGQLGRELKLSKFGSFIARLDGALTSFTHAAASRRLLWDIREASCFQRLLPWIESPGERELTELILTRYLTEVEPLLAMLPTQVIHNDLNPHNMLATSDSPTRISGVIDFGDMLRAPRVQEIATAAAYLIEAGPEPLAHPAALIGGYAAATPLDAVEARVLPLMMAMRMVATIAITSWRAKLQPENATYIRRNAPLALAGLRVIATLDWKTAAHALRLEEATHG